MDTETALALLCFFFAGWNWGEWWTVRQSKKRLGDDVGLKLLADMALQISERRKLVGRSMAISAAHKFKTPQENYTLTLEAEGDPATFDRELLP